MTNEEKQLLLRDICTRLPYNVKGTWYNSERISILSPSDIDMFNIENFKPYLRPMSSMTEEEDLEFIGVGLLAVNYGTNGNAKHKCKLSIPEIDWLNAHHFDYRGLIEKGLALEATENC